MNNFDKHAFDVLFMSFQKLIDHFSFALHATPQFTLKVNMRSKRYLEYIFDMGPM